MNKKGALIVISGPSGSGKTSVARAVCRQFGERGYFSISTTTRPKRKGEVDGKDYFFVSVKKFMDGVTKGEFIEWAEVHGNFYGTYKSQIDQNLEKGKVVFLDIDVQGHAQLKKLYPTLITSVFITTPSRNELVNRLRQRGEERETIKLRLVNAFREMERMREYEYLIINNRFQDAVTQLYQIAELSFLKINRLKVEKFISLWNGE